MDKSQWRVGELASRTGLTVRTLHHYDQIGLLRPSQRTMAGHRFYGREDIARLQQIRSLRQLGLSLQEIAVCLKRPGSSAKDILELHLTRLQEQIRLQQQLCRRLEALAERFGDSEGPSTDDLLKTIEVMTMFEKYITPEQMEKLDRRRVELGEEGIKAAEQEWPQLIAAMRAEMAKGEPPSERAQQLSRRWMELVSQFTGGDSGLAQSVRTAYEQEPGLATQFGLDGQLFAFVGKAYAAAKAGS
ncbi:MAG TPA: MerR family transcriptional regulator [Thermoanaerobaculia bacterium]|nr:MerR family transcriptional regulator [Thermoanaerobaculia bacterium]